MRRTELARSCFRASLGGQFDRARFAPVALRSTNGDARSWLIVVACPAGWGGTAAEGPSVDRNATANRTENTLGLPLRCEAEAATSSPTLRPRREVLPPSESTHACDHATFSEDPCDLICGSRASPSSSARIRSMIPVNGSSFGRADGRLRRYPGGTENASILATVRGSIPNCRAASRRLRPSI
jgi:hypothetical protein